MNIKHNIIAASLVGSVLIATSPVQANTTISGTAKQRVVSYADLDLAKSGGRTALERRIAGALRFVCNDYGNMSLVQKREIAKCRRDTSARVAPQLANAFNAHAPVQTAMIDR